MKYTSKSLGLAVLFMTLVGSALAQTQVSVTSKCKPDGPPQFMFPGDRAT